MGTRSRSGFSVRRFSFEGDYRYVLLSQSYRILTSKVAFLSSHVRVLLDPFAAAVGRTMSWTHVILLGGHAPFVLYEGDGRYARLKSRLRYA